MGPEPQGREQVKTLRDVVGRKFGMLRNIVSPAAIQLREEGHNLLDNSIGGGWGR